jgi:hypothetical protein
MALLHALMRAPVRLQRSAAAAPQQQQRGAAALSARHAAAPARATLPLHRTTRAAVRKASRQARTRVRCCRALRHVSRSSC